MRMVRAQNTVRNPAPSLRELKSVKYAEDVGNANSYQSACIEFRSVAAGVGLGVSSLRMPSEGGLPTQSHLD